MNHKEKFIIGVALVGAAWTFWEFGMIKQMLAAWFMFAMVFVPLLGFAFVLALFEGAGERGIAWAESNALSLYDGARRRLSHISWPDLPHRRPIH